MGVMECRKPNPHKGSRFGLAAGAFRGPEGWLWSENFLDEPEWLDVGLPFASHPFQVFPDAKDGDSPIYCRGRLRYTVQSNQGID